MPVTKINLRRLRAAYTAAESVLAALGLEADKGDDQFQALYQSMIELLTDNEAAAIREQLYLAPPGAN